MIDVLTTGGVSNKACRVGEEGLGQFTLFILFENQTSESSGQDMKFSLDIVRIFMDHDV